MSCYSYTYQILMSLGDKLFLNLGLKIVAKLCGEQHSMAFIGTLKCLSYWLEGD